MSQIVSKRLYNILRTALVLTILVAISFGIASHKRATERKARSRQEEIYNNFIELGDTLSAERWMVLPDSIMHHHRKYQELLKEQRLFFKTED